MNPFKNTKTPVTMSSFSHWLVVAGVSQLKAGIWQKELIDRVMFPFCVILAPESDTEQLRNKLCC
jgi:hypothetical protein